MAGRLHAVGVGPGDPELLTLKAARLIGAADVVAYYSGTRGASIDRSIVSDLITDDTVEELLTYPVTVGAVVAGGVAPSPSRSNGTCPASSAIRSRAIATSTASCSSSCAEPRCSTIVRTPRVFDAICTAVAPDAVRTFRTNHPTERV